MGQGRRDRPPSSTPGRESTKLSCLDELFHQEFRVAAHCDLLGTKLLALLQARNDTVVFSDVVCYRAESGTSLMENLFIFVDNEAVGAGSGVSPGGAVDKSDELFFGGHEGQ